MAIRKEENLARSRTVSCELEGCNQQGWIDIAIINCDKIIRQLGIYRTEIINIHF